MVIIAQLRHSILKNHKLYAQSDYVPGFVIPDNEVPHFTTSFNLYNEDVKLNLACHGTLSELSVWQPTFTYNEGASQVPVRFLTINRNNYFGRPSYDNAS